MDAMELALAGSPFALLDAHSSVRLVTDRVHEDDALCLALTCRALRDALWERFPRFPVSITAGCLVELPMKTELQRDIGMHPAGHKRIRTRDAAVLVNVARLHWVWELPQWQTQTLTQTQTELKRLRNIVRGDCLGHALLYAIRPDWLPREGGWQAPGLQKSTTWVSICLTAAQCGELGVLRWARHNDHNGCDC